PGYRVQELDDCRHGYGQRGPQCRRLSCCSHPRHRGRNVEEGDLLEPYGDDFAAGGICLDSAAAWRNLLHSIEEEGLYLTGPAKGQSWRIGGPALGWVIEFGRIFPSW